MEYKMDTGSIPVYSTGEKMENDYEDEIDKLIGDLEDIGVFEWVGMDETGERILKPNMELMKIHAPDMYQQILEDLDAELYNLFQLGYVDVEFDESGEPLYAINEKGREVMKENGLILDMDEEYNEGTI
jgi:hypothetical protein